MGSIGCDERTNKQNVNELNGVSGQRRFLPFFLIVILLFLM